ncbi:electron transport protein [Brevibacillus centrosporus]|uniref:electron transport protein n=1 Tax=Brevibacillus TaxID=55080 RepID=UPI0039869877
MKTGKWLLILGIGIVVIGAVSLLNRSFEYGYVPPQSKILTIGTDKVQTLSTKQQQFDVWGRSVSREEAEDLKKTSEGRKLLSSDNGAIEVTNELLTLGREAFYKETFGNEVFLTDILGIVNGPLTLSNFAKAIMELKGEGTTNLRVELAQTVTVGGKNFKKGEKIDTGLDVPKGAYAPLGMPVSYAEGRPKVGISCAACHATVDRKTKMVVEGVPNTDLNAGLLLALATNSTAYFTHAQIDDLKKYLNNLDGTVKDSKGKESPLPNPKVLEDAVDSTFLKWAPGNFDSTIDLKSNPSQIPDSFTSGDHPYGWSGFAAAGPFKGLSVFSNNVHAQNSDSLSQSEISGPLFGIDKEVYLGTILRNAANPKYRFTPERGMKPSQFFAAVDPTPGVPGVNEMVKPPTFPNVSVMAPDGLYLSSPGYRVAEQVNGMAAWQNTLVPPQRLEKAPSKETVEMGTNVFQRAGCITCHAGSAYTNHRVISANVIRTDPSRAKALKKTEKIFVDPVFYPPNTPVPVPPGSRTIQVPTQHLDKEQIEMGFAHGKSPGGYKVPSLIGLYWSAPYLHDGGVAVGPDVNRDVGMAGTLLKGVEPAPANSLRALVDKELRKNVITANQASKDLQFTHTKGIGHEFWVDASTGFTREEQDALIQYLLSLDSRSTP